MDIANPEASSSTGLKLLPHDAAVSRLRGVGSRVAERLQRLHIHTLQDLLLHLPLRYQDRTRLAPIGSLRPGDEVCVEAEVQLTEIKYGRRRMLISRISDGSGYLTLRFFNFNATQQQGLARGARLRCFGEVRVTDTGKEMVHPEYHFVSGHEPVPVSEFLTPLYPATEGLRQYALRALIDQLIIDSQHIRVQMPEWLPDSVLQHLRFPPLPQAIAYLHRPPPQASLDLLKEGKHPAQRRLAFEELLAYHLSLRKMRQQQQQHLAPVCNAPDALLQRFIRSLPFELTAAQHRVIEHLRCDLAKRSPMLRLVQGDVGSGKTVVAAAATLCAVAAGYQVAIMAPTEILAYQHLLSFQQWLSPLDIELQWLSSKVKGKARSAALQAISSGTAKVIIGTQALFQDEVLFASLGLVVIDEQHRFGVHQRLALRNKGAQTEDGALSEVYPHQLIMTATPIPRTLAMTAYADLDISVIDELPPGRTPVETVVLGDSRREEVIARVYEACKEGRQAYWVCTLIEESEALQCQAAEDTAALLRQELPGIQVGLVHGRMKTRDKDQVMAAFKAGETHLLVATTVIEVGVDVPNASLMIIENPERLGLSQLHQLRGRVGRGSTKSVCVLMYRAPLSQHAKARLAIMRETTDGFVIAQRDLELRGPGEFLGIRQTGVVQFRIADLGRDRDLLNMVAQTATALLQHHPQAADAIVQRWLGSRRVYSQV